MTRPRKEQKKQNADSEPLDSRAPENTFAKQIDSLIYAFKTKKVNKKALKVGFTVRGKPKD